MNISNSRPAYVAGTLAEYLAISAGIVNERPVAVLTFRPHSAPTSPLNLMISRPHLERLRDDIAFLLEHSPSLKDGPSPEVPLATLEAFRDRLA